MSIREASDTLVPESCRTFAAQSEKPTSFDEIVIDTGRSHGAMKRVTQRSIDDVERSLHCANGRNDPARGHA